jgi:stage II sporulation protein D
LQAKSFLVCLLATASALTVCAWLFDGHRPASPAPPPTLQFRPFNYPGMKTATSPPPARTSPQKLIRVGVLQERTDRITLTVDGAYSVRRDGEARPLDSFPRLSAARVVATKNGIRIGEREFKETSLELIPAASPAAWIDGHQYRGTVRIIRQSASMILAVNVLSLDDYLASVVDSEMPLEFGDAARQAQAIVARTYALYQMQQSGAGSPFDLHASTRSQKYLGFQFRADDGRMLAGESAESRRIVEATRGQVLTFRGRLFCTYYCAVCGGRTLNGSEMFGDAAPPLRSVACSWCAAAKNYRWSVELPKSTFAELAERHFRQEGTLLGKLRSVRSVGTASPGNMPEFEFSGDRGRQRVTGDVVRRIFKDHGVMSPRMSVTERRSTWLLSGSGHGHGAGMCQWGARGMGQSGMTYRQILSHYYPGSDLTTVAGFSGL